jgi:hypothetical protein
MRGVALGSVITLILFTGLVVSQVEAKNNNNDDNGKNKHEAKSETKHLDNHDGKGAVRFEGKHEKQEGNGRSVPIPGTLLALGGGLVGVVAWRARRQKPQD